MQTRFSRRLLRRNKEETIAEQPQEAFKPRKIESQTPDSVSQTSETVIADLAKSFMQLQANAGKASADSPNQEVVGLLEKLNRQLANLQQAVETKERPDEQGQAEAAPKNSEELCKLFSQYLQNNGQEKESVVNSELLGGQSKAAGRKTTGGAQTAQELLTRTQYELANELEDSLKKLKQVIQESEKVAARISNMLDTENK